MSNTKHSNCLKTGTLFASVLVAGISGATAQNATTPAQAPAPAAPVPAVEVKKPYWEMSAALGSTLTSGNSDSVMVTAGFLANHKDLKNEIHFSIEGGYGESKVKPVPATGPDSQLNAQFVRSALQYNRLFTERFYGYARVDGLYDAVAGVDYRFTFSPGVGYYFIKTDKVLLSGEVGPGVVTEQLVSKPPSGSNLPKQYDYNTYATIRLGENFEYKLTDKTRIWQSLEYLPNISGTDPSHPEKGSYFEEYILNATIGIETALTPRISLRSFLQDTYNSNPAPGRLMNDLKWITGVAYKF